MSESTELEKALLGAQDLILTESSTPVNQSRLGTTGAYQTVAITPVNTDSIPTSTATQALSGLSGKTTLHAVLGAIVAGSAFQYASTAQNGQVHRMSAAPAIPGQPIAMEENDARVGYIPSSAQKAALGLSTGFSVSLSETAGTANGYATANQLRNLHGGQFGHGKDGAYKVGAITDPATAPSGLSAATSGGYIPAGTHTYKVTFGNTTGETLPSSASGSVVTTGSTSAVTMTVPTGGTNTAWRKLYRDSGGGTWRQVAYIPDNTTTTWTDFMPTGGQAAPGSNTTAASWSNPTGEYHFDGDTTISAATSVGTTGTFANVLIIRVRGVLTISAAITSNANVQLASGSPGNVLMSNAGGTYAGKGMSGLPWPVYGIQGCGKAGTVGGTGSSGTPGKAGGTILIFAWGVIVEATGSVTCNGGNGTASSGTYTGGPGGGAGGFVRIIAAWFAWVKASGVVQSAGGNGGNASGSGGASPVTGGGGGSGGYVFIYAPIYLNDGTVNAPAGTAGSASNTGTGSAAGGVGGGFAADGGAAGASGTAGVVSTPASGAYWSDNMAA